MNLKKGLVLGIALVLGIYWASAALASSISITSVPHISIGGDIPGVPSEHSETSWGSFFFEANAPGSFSKIGDGGGGWANISWTTHGPYYTPGADSFPCSAGGGVGFTFMLTQEGPLRFTSASWTATLHNYYDGVDTILLHADGDADLLKDGGSITSGASFDLGITAMPVTWLYNMIDPDHPELGGWYDGNGATGVAFDIRLVLTGTVIDTSAPAPLPSALLLLGSGLGGLAFYGRRIQKLSRKY